MLTVPYYIAMRFLQRFLEFFRHWYSYGSRFIWDQTLGALTGLDKTLAVPVTLRHLFEPLYQDRTVMGYILGFIFRTLRVLLGLSIYVVVATIALALYLAWIALPAFLIFKFIENIFL